MGKYLVIESVTRVWIIHIWIFERIPIVIEFCRGQNQNCRSHLEIFDDSKSLVKSSEANTVSVDTSIILIDFLNGGQRVFLEII